MAEVVHQDPDAPDWLRGAKRIWVEDDSGVRDRERIEAAWKRLFGEAKPKVDARLASKDYGDTCFNLYPLGRIGCVAYDGCSIWQTVGGKPAGVRRSEARSVRIGLPAAVQPPPAETLAQKAERVGRGELTPAEREDAARRKVDFPSPREAAEAVVADMQRQMDRAVPEDRRGPTDMAPAFERILSRTFAVDALAVADELEGQLAIPDADRVDYGTLARRVGLASDNARKAHLLYVNAVAAKEEFEARVETTMAALRARAHAALAADELAGKLGKKKTITNDDVDAKMAEIAPDEFERTRVKRAKVRLMVEQLGREAELHKYFPKTIEALLQTSRSP